MKLIISLLATASLSCFANTTVIYNVNGYTPTYQGETQHFSALVFKDGKVVKTGDDSIKKASLTLPRLMVNKPLFYLV